MRLAIPLNEAASAWPTGGSGSGLVIQLLLEWFPFAVEMECTSDNKDVAEHHMHPTSLFLVQSGQ